MGSIRRMKSQHIGDMELYGVIGSVRIDCKKYKTDRLKAPMYFVRFKRADLSDPCIDPIGMFYYAGTRRYLWNEAYWNEAAVDYRLIGRLVSKEISDIKDKLEVNNCQSRMNGYENRLESLNSIAIFNSDYEKSHAPVSVILPIGSNSVKSISKFLDNISPAVYCRAVYKIDVE